MRLTFTAFPPTLRTGHHSALTLHRALPLGILVGLAFLGCLAQPEALELLLPCAVAFCGSVPAFLDLRDPNTCSHQSMPCPYTLAASAHAPAYPAPDLVVLDVVCGGVQRHAGEDEGGQRAEHRRQRRLQQVRGLKHRLRHAAHWRAPGAPSYSAPDWQPWQGGMLRPGQRRPRGAACMSQSQHVAAAVTGAGAQREVAGLPTPSLARAFSGTGHHGYTLSTAP